MDKDKRLMGRKKRTHHSEKLPLTTRESLLAATMAQHSHTQLKNKKPEGNVSESLLNLDGEKLC